MKRYFSVGGIVYRVEDGVKKILLCKGASNPEYAASGEWMLPKGWIDDENGGPGPRTLGVKRASEEEMQASALREVREEGGVEAVVEGVAGYSKFFYMERGERVMKTVKFYVMKYMKDYEKGFDANEVESVEWCSLDEVRSRLNKRKSERVLIDQMARYERK